MFKIIIIGDPCCGKTSMLLRTVKEEIPLSHKVTVGVDCKSKLVKKGDSTIKL